MVPDEARITQWAKANGVKFSEGHKMADLCANEKLKSDILADLARVANEGSLCSFEQV